jgi:AcrR family transcriptional regulator
MISGGKMSTPITKTKTKIIDTALLMFAKDGYDKVTMRDIAGAVGILSGSIYGHYKSKESILRACYDYYLEHRFINRLTKEQYLPILKDGTKKDVVNALNYTFNDDILDKMIAAVFIIYARLYIDPAAKEIYADEINESLRYLNEFFRAGIEIGRFHEFNIATISLIYFSARLFTAHSVTLKPAEADIWREAEVDMFDELASIIPFKY